jgi:hypothetical protein
VTRYFNDETSEQREARWAREEAEALAKAQKAWETYKTQKPIEKHHDRDGRETTYTFLDWVKETDTERRTKTTWFRLQGGKVVYMSSSTAKKQKFLVVSGPKAGERLTDEDEDYVLFNVASMNYGRKIQAPRCVLVHKSSFK